MHISKVQLVNYRNFASADIRFNRGINTIIGENGSGKTNLFRAIVCCSTIIFCGWLTGWTKQDFHRGLGPWRGHWIIISLEFQKSRKTKRSSHFSFTASGTLRAAPLALQPTT